MSLCVWLNVHIFYGSGPYLEKILEKPLEKPISFAVLSKDLQTLETAYPSANLWPNCRVIKYSDQVQIVVNNEVQFVVNAADHNNLTIPEVKVENFLVVVGTITVAKLEKLTEPFEGFSNKIEVHKLMFQDGSFYFDDPKSEPVLNLHEYYIVSYGNPYGQLTENPAIEYITEEDLERELRDAISRIRFEGTVTRALRVQSYYRMKNGVRLKVSYGRTIEFAIFRQAVYHILVMSAEKDLVMKTVQMRELSFDLLHQFIPELALVGPVYGVRIAPLPTQPQTIASRLKVQRKILLKDMIETCPQKKQGKDIVETIKYDDGKEYVLKYVTTNQRELRCLCGKFVDNDGTAFSRLCVEFPEGKAERNGECWFPSSEDYTKNPIFFGRARDIEADIVLQEDSDYIELDLDTSQATGKSGVSRETTTEPYVEYISFEKFSRTINIVEDALQIECAKSHRRQSFRLFHDISMNYDCTNGMADFSALDLWVGPGQDASSWENFIGVSYDRTTNRFNHEGEILADFKVRQLYPVNPGNLPVDVKYNDEIYVAFDVRSVEWDMYQLGEYMITKQMSSHCMVRVDNFVLFSADKAEEEIAGEKKWIIRMKTVVSNGTDNCNEKECLVSDEIIYDGWSIIMRSSLPNKQEQVQVPSKVYWPKHYKLPALKDIFSLAYQIRYVQLPTLKKHMKELTIQLQKRSKELKQNGGGNKFKIHINYFKSETSMIGYYDSALNYIFFTSDFKFIKLSNIRGESTASGQEEEKKIGINDHLESNPGSPTTPNLQDVNLNQNTDRTTSLYETGGDELRESRKNYSDYIIQDLLYDPIENTFRSRTTFFLIYVYAVRALPTNVKDPTAKKDSIRIKIEEGPDVLVFYDTVVKPPNTIGDPFNLDIPLTLRMGI